MPATSSDDSAKDDSKVASDLLDNADSFVREAVGYAERAGPRDWVFAVAHLAIGLELTLKAILRSEHWSLLFEEVSAASKRALEEGKFKSVPFPEAVRRSREIAGVSLEDKDWRYLIDLNRLRNQVLHYEFSLNVHQVKGVPPPICWTVG